ncbi:MAG: zinc ribbon domain-containing protein [Dehalococcoidia bacterium]|nr:zinc ribbon domain-containing protein [Dehalococcoidia bacterium]
MKNVKPGRGPSGLSAIVGIVIAIAGISMVMQAASFGAPSFFIFFGVAFVVVSIVMVIYNLINATSNNRFSSFDITDENEEPDPISKRFRSDTPSSDSPGNFCPYCGTPAAHDYSFCKKCGRLIQ